MKTITIDLETPIEFAAIEGENNADSVCVKLPAEMRGYPTYIIRRKDGFGRTSDSLPLQEKNNTVIMALTQDILRGSNLQLQLIAIDESRDEISKSEIFSISVSPALHADSEQSEAAGDLLKEMVSVFERVSEAISNSETAVTNAEKAMETAENASQATNSVINEITEETQRVLGESIERTNRLIGDVTDESTRVLNGVTENASRVLNSFTDESTRALNNFAEESKETLQSSSDAVAAAEAAVEIAKTAADNADGAAQMIRDKLASGELVGEKGDKGDKGDKGERGDKGENGAPGAKGDNGYSPVKGVDYWTASDKREIVDSVLSSLPDGDEVAY